MAIQAGETTFYQAKRGIVQDGLVLNLDAAVDASYNGGTTWRDLTGDSNNNATLFNSPTFSKDNGGKFITDATNSYLRCPQNASLNFTNLSTSVSCEIIDNGQTQYFFERYDNQGYLIAATYSGGSYRFSFHGRESSAAYLQCNTSYSYSPGKYIVTVTKSGSTWKIYVNGSETVSTTLGNGTTAFTTKYIYFGGLPHYSDYSNATVYNCQVYNRALTATEVLQNYNATRHRFGV